MASNIATAWLQVGNARGTLLVRRVVDKTAELLAAKGQLATSKSEELPRILVGMDARRDGMVQAVQAAAAARSMVLLHGMGRIGKTTLAKAVFNQLHSMDRTVPCHFARLHSGMKEPSDVLPHQVELLKQLAGMDAPSVTSADNGCKTIADALKGKKVLLVVDDVWGGQLGWLLPEDLMVLLGQGSMVLVTSRDRAAAHSFGKVSGLVVEQLGCLPEHESLELFCRHAYSSCTPPDSEREEVQDAVNQCGGLPGALEVVGKHVSTLDDGNDGRQRFLDDVEGGLCAVYAEEGSLFQLLGKSWDVLNPGEQRATLLDIVWFLQGQRVSWLEAYCGYQLLGRLEDLGLVQQHLDSATTYGARVDVHCALSSFCKHSRATCSSQRRQLGADHPPNTSQVCREIST
jgi:hypothetical protein